MKMVILLILGYLAATFASASSAPPPPPPPPSISVHNQVFDSLSLNGPADNMPVGNGELVANVYVDDVRGGSLALLLGRSDVFDGNVAPQKLGRIRIEMEPNPFTFNRSCSPNATFVKHAGFIGDQHAFIDERFACTSAASCAQEAAARCNSEPACRSFAIDPAWGDAAQTYTDGFASAGVNPAWTLWERQCSKSSTGTFEQVLDLETGTVNITASTPLGVSVRIQVWGDAGSIGATGDAVHVQVVSSTPIAVSVIIDSWERRKLGASGARGLCSGAGFKPYQDTIVPEEGRGEGSLGWYRANNNESVFNATMSAQFLGPLAQTMTDPLAHRTSGALVIGLSGGKSLTRRNATCMETSAAGLSTKHTVAIYTHTAVGPPGPDIVKQLDALAAASPSPAAARAKHIAWWRSFWERSWIFVRGNSTATAVSEAYALHRYLMAIQSRGALALHHNGGTVTWGWDGKTHDDPDARPWGGGYWFQNVRQVYWYMLAAGDYDLMTPLFNHYTAQLTVLEARSKRWFKHSGARFAETSYFFGAYEPSDYGCDPHAAADPLPVNKYIQRHIEGGVELAVMMLAAYQHSGDVDVLKTWALRWCESLFTFYDQHYPKLADGTIDMLHAQSCETWLDCVNPAPMVSALHRMVEGLTALPPSLLTPKQITFFARIAKSLPPIPLTVGKNGKPAVSPCKGGFPTSHQNAENTETYAIWPYEYFAVNRTTKAPAEADVDPEITGVNTFNNVHFGHTDGAWRYEGQVAALLGMGSDAWAKTVLRVQGQGWCDGSRFHGYLASDAGDGAPQIESNGIIAVTLQKMLLQTEGRRILIFPAFIKGIDVDMLLHVPGASGAPPATVRLVSEAGKVTYLDVTPSSRLADVVMFEPQESKEVIDAALPKEEVISDTALKIQRLIPFASSPSSPIALELWFAPAGYRGCWLDRSDGSAALPGGHGTTSSLTPSMCRNICAKQHAPFFGMRGGDQCYCGNGTAPTAGAPRGVEEDCWAVCSGEENGRCGGPHATSLYSVSDAAVLPSAVNMTLNASLAGSSSEAHVVWSSVAWRTVPVTQRTIGVAVRRRFNLTLPPHARSSLTRWDIDNPVLYVLAVGGVAARIGFRTIARSVAGQILLNDRPMFLRGIAINAPGRGLDATVASNATFAHAYLSTLRTKYGVNFVRIESGDQGGAATWWSAADEVGILVFQGRYGAPRGGSKTAPPTDLNASLEAYKSEYFEAQATHPSLIIRILSNEMNSHSTAFDAFFTRQCAALAVWDPTRLCLGNAGFGGGRSGDLNDAHPYAGWYGGMFDGVAFGAAAKLDPSVTPPSGGGLPFTASECVGSYTGPNGRFTVDGKQLCAALFHGGTHANASQRAIDDLEYQRFMVKQVTEPMRWLRAVAPRLAGLSLYTPLWYNWNGVSAFKYMRAKPALKQLTDSYSPILIAIEVWERNVFAGSAIHFSLHVVNDDDSGADLEGPCTATCAVAGGRGGGGNSVAVASTPYYAVTSLFNLSIAVPATVTAGEYVLNVSLICGGVLKASNTARVFIAKRSWAQQNTHAADDATAAATATTQLALFDSTGATSLALFDLGVQFVAVKSLRVALPPAVSALILGESIWNTEMDDAATQNVLRAFVQDGGRVALLAQSRPANLTKTSLSWLPLDVKVSATKQMNVNAARPRHPLWEGGLERHLGEWNAATASGAASSFLHTKALPNIYPVSTEFSVGNRTSVDTLARSAVHANFERGLDGVAMLEVFAPAPASAPLASVPVGSVLLCGFGLVSRAARDPIAARLLRNIATYVAQEEEHDSAAAIDGRTLVWGDYASESGIVTGSSNGLLVHTAKVGVPNPGSSEFQIEPAGRRLLSFRYATNCGVDDLDPMSESATGTAFVRLVGEHAYARVRTAVSNPSDATATLSATCGGGEASKAVLVPKGDVAYVECAFASPLRSGGTGAERTVQLTFVGGKGLVLVNSSFS